jgi:hypothetical protein
MTLRERLGELWHLPGLAAVTGLLGVVGIDPFGVWSVVQSTANIWFPAVAVTSTTIAEQIAEIPDGLGQQVLFAAAVLYVLTLLDRLSDRLTERYDL